MTHFILPSRKVHLRVKHYPEYTPVRRFYACVGFAALVVMVVHGIILIITDLV